MNTTHDLHVIRDATRGGVGTVLYEIAGQSNVGIRLDAASVPVAPEVKGVCGMLGLEPLYLACEGRMVIMAPKAEAEKIVETLRRCPYSKDAAIIGEVTADQPGKVVMTTEIGTQALLPQPGGELYHVSANCEAMEHSVELLLRRTTMDTRVAVISIIVEDSDSIETLNQLLYDARDYIIGRMGIPYREKESASSASPSMPHRTLSAPFPARSAASKACPPRPLIPMSSHTRRKNMIKIAVYGKGGIGKSTTVSNVAATLAEKGLTVMQIGCDPKADSTIQLRHGKQMRTVLDLYNEKKQNLKLEDMITTGYQSVICVEAGGPTPGLGCAGRGSSLPSKN